MDSVPHSPLGRGSSGCDSSQARVGKRSQVLLAALSIATVLFVLLQLAVGLRMTDRYYPVTGYSMFSHGSDGTYVMFELSGLAVDGEAVEIEPEDLGLTQLQFISHLVSRVEAVDGLEASARLGEIASIYTERDGRTLDALTLLRIEEHVDGVGPPPGQVATWTR